LEERIPDGSRSWTFLHRVVKEQRVSTELAVDMSYTSLSRLPALCQRAEPWLSAPDSPAFNYVKEPSRSRLTGSALCQDAESGAAAPELSGSWEP